MRGILIKRAMLALVLGAVGTFLVAWACALWVKPDAETYLSFAGSPRMLHGFGAQRLISYRLADQKLQPVEDPTITVHDERGWPLRCMAGTFVIHSTDPRSTVDETHAAILINPASSLPGGDKTQLPMLPLQPLSRNFAVNTMLYGSVVFVLLITPRILQRVHRHRRGLCLACGYDLRGIEAADEAVNCPECGTANRMHVRESADA